MHDWFICEHDHPGSLRSVQRYVRDHFPAPRYRARRRVETPPGAQTQVDWAVFPRINIDRELVTLNTFNLTLSGKNRVREQFSRILAFFVL